MSDSTFYVKMLDDVMSPVIGVELGAKLVYPMTGWKPLFPKLHAKTGRYYDLTRAVDFGIYPQQKWKEACTGHYLFDLLKKEGVLGRALTLYDCEAIGKKDPSLVLECPFGRKNWMFWGSISKWGSRIAVPYKCVRGGTIVQDWKNLDERFDFSCLTLLFIE